MLSRSQISIYTQVNKEAGREEERVKDKERIEVLVAVVAVVVDNKGFVSTRIGVSNEVAEGNRGVGGMSMKVVGESTEEGKSIGVVEKSTGEGES
jgi:hypothetical protein